LSEQFSAKTEIHEIGSWAANSWTGKMIRARTRQTTRPLRAWTIGRTNAAPRIKIFCEQKFLGNIRVILLITINSSYYDIGLVIVIILKIKEIRVLR
jgi:hypothetical protein